MCALATSRPDRAECTSGWQLPGGIADCHQATDADMPYVGLILNCRTRRYTDGLSAPARGPTVLPQLSSSPWAAAPRRRQSHGNVTLLSHCLPTRLTQAELSGQRAPQGRRADTICVLLPLTHPVDSAAHYASRLATLARTANFYDGEMAFSAATSLPPNVIESSRILDAFASIPLSMD